MTATITTALFDVDGTLVDSNYLHVVSWWEAFTQAGHEVPMVAIHRAIGMGSDQLLDAVLPSTRDREADAGIRAAHSTLYATYRPRLRPLPAAPELLRACRKSGLQVVLASSADPQELGIMREVLGAEDAIETATSAGEVQSSKPAPDLVQVALEKARIPPEQAVLVGDTVWDVQACQRAGVPCIGVRSGGISTGELLDAGAVAVFADPADLLEATAGRLAELLPGRPGR
jgi:HAD superfamily hydrolase (TIGR01509 family)